MKNIDKNVLPLALLSIALFIMGKLLFSRIFGFFEPGIAGIMFQITDDGGRLQTSYLFSFAVASMPLIIIFAWRFAPVISNVRRICFLATILVAMSAAVFIRHKEVEIYFNTVARPALLLQNRLPMQYPINPVNFVYYIIGGFLIGLVISFFVFRQKTSGSF